MDQAEWETSPEFYMSPVRAPVVVAEGLDDLVRLKVLRDDVETMIVKAVREARRKGYSWYKIGPALGVSRQAAEERYKKKVKR